MTKFLERPGNQQSSKQNRANKINITEGLTFDDVLIIPKYSEIEHRADVDCSTEILPNFKLTIPFVSANMDTITEYRMAFAMAEAGGLGILHRFLSIEDMLKQIDLYNELAQAAEVKTPFVVAIGVHDEERIKAAYDKGIRQFCVDVAHGHHILVKRTIEYLRKEYGKEIGIIAGNVCTYEGAYALFEWGADCIKVGVGPGSVCSTRIKTGAGYPQLSAIMHASDAREDFETKFAIKKYIIGDGGIKNYGDVSKAISAGADAVMMGSIFAGCKQTPGPVWRNEKEEMIKTYRGMASTQAQSDFGIEDINEEGISLTTKYKGNIDHILSRLVRGLKSGMSYSGSRTIPEMQAEPNFVQMSSAGYHESTPHKASN